MPEIDFAAIQAEDAATLTPKVVETPLVSPFEGALTEPPAAPVPAPGEEAPAPAEPSEAEKAKSAVDKRFATLTAKRREAERRAVDAEDRLQKLLARQSEASPKPNGALKPADFATYEDYTAAIAVQAASQAIESARTEERTKAQAEVQERSKDTFRQRLAKEGKAIEGFADVLQTVFETQDIHISPPMAEFLMEDADHSALLVKWLHDNPDEAEQISEMRPAAQVKELVRRDGLLGKSAKPVTKAPPPTPSVSGSAPAPQAIERMSHEDLKKLVKGWQK